VGENGDLLSTVPYETKRGFYDPLEVRLSSLFVLLVWSSNSVASLMSRPMYVENPAFLELCGMVMVEPTFCHRRYIWISKRRVLVVLLYSGLYRPTGLYDVHLDTLIQSAVYSWRTQSQLVLHRTEEAGELPKRQANYSDVMLMKHSADPTVFRLDIWKKNDRGGLVSRLCGCNLRVEGTSYLYDATTIFPEIGLEELELIMESSLVTQNPESVHRG